MVSWGGLPVEVFRICVRNVPPVGSIVPGVHVSLRCLHPREVWWRHPPGQWHCAAPGVICVTCAQRPQSPMRSMLPTCCTWHLWWPPYRVLTAAAPRGAHWPCSCLLPEPPCAAPAAGRTCSWVTRQGPPPAALSPKSCHSSGLPAATSGPWARASNAKPSLYYQSRMA